MPESITTKESHALPRGNALLIGSLANEVLPLVVRAAMLFGALALLAGLVWLTEGARWFAHLSHAAVQLPPFPLWVLLGIMRWWWGGDCCGIE